MTIEITCLALVVIFLLIVLIFAWRKESHSIQQEQLHFNEQWPPIDEEEFLRRCEPGTSLHVAQGVRHVLSDCLGVPYEQIYPEQRLTKELGAE